MEEELIATENEGKINAETVQTQECRHGRIEGECKLCRYPFYNHVWKMVFKKNRNVLILIEGPPGTGKSYTSLELACVLDPNFNEETMKERVIFEPEKFLDLLRTADKKNPEFIEGKLPKGSVIILEEFGIQDDHRKWYTFNNTIVNYILQTFRFMNLIVIFNVPISEFIDADARKLFQFHIETVDVMESDEHVKAKIKEQTYNSSTKKIYRKFLSYKVNSEWLKFKYWYFNKPPFRICHQYERMHQEFKLGLYHDLSSKMELLKRTSEERRKPWIDIPKAVKEVEDRISDFTIIRANRKIIDLGLVEAYFNIGRHQANRIKKEIELKFKIEEGQNKRNDMEERLRRKDG